MVTTDTMPTERSARQWLAALVDFCQAHGGHCYEGWDRRSIEGYIFRHMQQGTFGWTREGGRVIGCAVMWQTHETELRHNVRPNRHPFYGQLSDPKGDCLFLAEFVATTPAARRSLLAYFDQRFPSWQSLKLFTTRRGRDGTWRLRQYPAGLIARWKGEIHV